MNNEKILIIDPSLSGVSGDMLISAFVDMGFPQNNIDKIITVLNKRFQYGEIKQFKFNKISRQGFKATELSLEIKDIKSDVSVIKLKEILELCINDLKFDKNYKNYALDVFDSLIQAEVKVHEKELEIIHFHELASIDTIFDILCTTSALNYFQILNNATIYLNPIPVGGGIITFSHGKTTIPTPVVLEILKKYRIPFKFGPINEELLTPTGIALIANLKPQFNISEIDFIIGEIGNGAGNKIFSSFPNVIKLMYGENYSNFSKNDFKMDKIVILETNLDDIKGEKIGYTINKLIQSGAKDVNIFSTVTKKNRPGYLMQVLSPLDCEKNIVEKIFELTGTLGIRYTPVNRYILKRSIEKIKIKVNNEYFELRVKKIFTPKGEIRFKPEFDDIVKIAEKTGLEIDQVEQLVLNELNSKN